MEKISIVERNADGQVEAGIHFWHTPGQAFYLYQTWEYRAAGNHYSAVNPDPVLTSAVSDQTDLEYTVRQCWLAQVGMEIDSHDKFYR